MVKQNDFILWLKMDEWKLRLDMFRETDENIAEVMSNKYTCNFIAHVMKSFDWELINGSHQYTANGGEIRFWICVGKLKCQRVEKE